MSHEYRLIVKYTRLDSWEVYDRVNQMTYAPAQTKSEALDKARGRATTLANNTGQPVGIEKRTKTGKKSFEKVQPTR